MNSTSYHCVLRLTHDHSTLVQIILAAAHRRYQFPRPIQNDIDNLLFDVVLSCRMGTQIHSPCFSILRTLPSRFAISLTLLALLFTLARARHKHPRSRSIAQAVTPLRITPTDNVLRITTFQYLQMFSKYFCAYHFGPIVCGIALPFQFLCANLSHQSPPALEATTHVVRHS